MLLLIFSFIFIILIVWIVKNKIVLRVDTFFRKGFKKNDDKYGVYCFTGKQGDGKTYSLVDTLSQTGKNKIKICNIKSLCTSGYMILGIENFDKKHIYDNGYVYIYETDFNKIVQFLEKRVDADDFIIVYDEIFTLIEKGKLSKDCLAFLSQMRKRGLYLYTTAQEWLEINITFRRYVRYQIVCKMINLPIFNCALSINEINDAYQMKWDNFENDYIAPRIKTTIKKCSKKIADSYDTFETIETQGKLVGTK